MKDRAMLGANGRDNVRLEESKSCPGAWYWKVITFDGETFAEGDGEAAYDFAVHAAANALAELQAKESGVEND